MTINQYTLLALFSHGNRCSQTYQASATNGYVGFNDVQQK
jgi:hypothetical protein